MTLLRLSLTKGHELVTRAFLKKKLAFLSLAFLFLCSLEASPQHGLSLGGELKYPKGFSHFDYVNPKAPKGGELRFGRMGTFDSLNPFVIKGRPAAGQLPLHHSYTYATLLIPSHDEAFSKYGYVAESVTVAEDHLSVSFKIRETATFHDGTPITPEDVIFTFQTLTEKGHPLFKAYYHDVKEVISPSPGVVTFVFKVADNKELPLIVGEMPILSKAFFQKKVFDDASLTPILGSGPYKVGSVEAGRTITYERIQNWWGADLPVMKGMYNFDRITFDYYRDDSVAFEAFKGNEYDIRLEHKAQNWALGYQDLVASGQVNKLELVTKKAEPMQGLIYNTRRDVFANKVLRRALSYAFDFEWMNKNLYHNLYERTSSYFQDSELAATGLPKDRELSLLETYKDRLPEEVFTQPYTVSKTDGSGRIRPQLAEAKALLKKAGFEIQQGKLIDPGTRRPVSFEILIAQADMKRILLGFVKNLRLLGVEANLRIVDTAQYVARVQNFDYDMIVGVLAQSLSPGNEQREFWHSNRASQPGSRNYAGIQDSIVDELIEILNDAKNRDELVQATRALDRVLLWGHYVIPMYHSPKTFIAYWPNKVSPPQTFPDYLITFDTWWAREP